MIRVREEKGRRKKIREEKGTRRKIKAREKVEKSRNTVFFPMFRGSGGSKSGLAKAAGAEPSGRMRGQKLHAVAARNFEVKMLKAHHSWSTFGSLGVEKARAAVARSTCGSQNVQSTPFSEVEMFKSTQRCGAKHGSKSIC